MPLPFGPVLGEQFANNFTGLIGGTVATTALVIRFFQKQGRRRSPRSVGRDELARGRHVQIVLVVVGLVFPAPSSRRRTPAATSSGWHLRRRSSAVVLAVCATSLFVPKLARVVSRIVAATAVAPSGQLRGHSERPRKAAMIFGGNLCSQMAVRAGDRRRAARVRRLAAAAADHRDQFAGVAARRHGAGARWHGRHRGRPDRRHRRRPASRRSMAVAATFTPRLFTAYLPPIWGWFSLQWLRRNDYI